MAGVLVGLPTWLRGLHSFVTYGQNDAEYVRDLWRQHLTERSVEEGRPLGLRLLPEAVWASAEHVGARILHGNPTALPAAIFITLSGLSSLQLATNSEAAPDIPLWVELLTAGSLLILGVGLFVSPTIVSRVPVAIGMVGVSVSGVAGLTHLEILHTVDWLLVAGWVLLSAGSLAAAAVLISTAPDDRWWRITVRAAAVGAGAVALANAAWTQLFDSPADAVSAFAVAATGAAGALAVDRIGGLPVGPRVTDDATK